ncbi:tRNA (adenosine(37)-N6)-threonylcarbamoyltransferase complex dimerization subunit type 1 TsaB [Aerococcaceae bacterium DSM 111176]|nr:tRNA (adenosine(37)-N6)-threonylcarbamoyltransferase complex dimerization subunit type 1 TsaB [Aerococcaceae bacterium DSM 111176]
MTILAFDTATKNLSVALAKNNEDKDILLSYQYAGGKQHGEIALPAIQTAMRELTLAPKDISGIIVGVGPGSYTGLRIGVTIAKTWAESLKIPLSAISSLALMLPNALLESNALYIPMMDARRQTVYTGIYQSNKNKYQAVIPDQHLAWTELKTIILDYINENPGISKIYLIGDSVTVDYQTDLQSEISVDVVGNSTQTGMPHAERAFETTHEQLLNEVTDISTLIPNYAHLTLAEQEWQEKQEGQDSGTAEEFIDITH